MSIETTTQDELPSPGGAAENSPTIHRWVTGRVRPSPAGTAETFVRNTLNHPEQTNDVSLTPSFSWVLARQRCCSTVKFDLI